uniref:F-box domain-containing protein n=1 Tax=Plectus sambesii TaxID=2011161 RepID=A0A914X181_9BILA
MAHQQNASSSGQSSQKDDPRPMRISARKEKRTSSTSGTSHIMVLRRRSSNAVVVEPQTVAESPAPAGEVFGSAATPSLDGSSCRYALRRRRSLQQKDEEGCCASSLAATADDALMEPSKKRLKLDSPGEARNNGAARQSLGYWLPSSDGSCFVDTVPDEILLKVFSFLLEGDLGHCASVSNRFYRISNDVGVWKALYQSVFEYTTPLYHMVTAKFEFREPPRWKECPNAWKESFKQLRHGVHVRPRRNKLYEGQKGRNLVHFDRLETALRFLETRQDKEKLIFLHAGHFYPEPLVIDSAVQIVGAAPGPHVQRKIIIEQSTETTLSFVDGANGAYLGYCSVKFNPDKNSTVPHQLHYAIQVTENATPVIDHCSITSTSIVGAAVCVKKQTANPKMKHCSICDCENVGIYITDSAQ